MAVLSDLVQRAGLEMQAVLLPAADLGWEVRAGDLDWTCLATAAHLADDLFSYASQVIAQPEVGYLPIEAVIEPSAGNAEILRAVQMCGRLLALAVDSMPAEARAWHPYGTSDPEGFAAMGVVEVLVHCYDTTRGLGLDWAPPAECCSPVLERLFPDAPQGDPSEVLLHVTGRAALADRPRLTQWAWDSSVRAPST
ncbi:hypothetical protein [Terrabacter carboxydivorans]|uniref:Mycothiol-dependent maleylpyruvate isomerase metal-binding domain-containing protein n=1 Tax=Terrabacter carboxydivorans TaxID=619730 RepID=A0ABN3LQ64_9MICO